MSFNHELWEATMRRAHGANWREEMRRRGQLGGSRSGISKGFASMSKEKHLEISRSGGAATRRRRHGNQRP